MKLNPDCIRDILFAVEETTTFDDDFYYGYEGQTSERLKKYPSDVVMYHIRQCDETGFFIGCKLTITDEYYIDDLSPLAHQFLADIRSDNAWNKTKEIAKGIGTFSLDALKQIATSVTAALIQGALGNSQS
ncbi:MAG: hypothetical protein K0S76_1873 [Herbinix sp.]|jgi:hypothetical protein|nr:hypothetical protein [Herbinix sp.]